MYPHERSLVKRLQDRPFVLLGVNTDQDRQQLKEVIKQERISWRSWWDSPVKGRTSISQNWGIEAFPTLFLLDQGGVIRKRWDGSPRTSDLDRAIDQLLAEAL